MTKQRLTKSVLSIITALLLAPQAGLARPTTIMVEDAIEARSVELFVNANGVGTAVVRACKECEPVKLAVSPDTKAIQGGTEVPLSAATRLLETDVVVFFIVENETVSRITW